MKKVLKLLSVVFAFVILAITVMPTNVQAASKMADAKVSFNAGQTKKLSIKKGAINTYKIIGAKSSDDSVCTVVKTAPKKVFVTGVSEGNATITVTIKSRYSGKKENAKVNVEVKAAAQFYANDFTVIDEKGEYHKISEYAGQPMLINFWADWCYWCMVEMPDMYEAYKNYKNDVKFIFVCCDDYGYSEVSQASDFLKEQAGGKLPVYFESYYDSGSWAYQVTGIPRTIMIGGDGYLVHDKSGAYTDYNTLKNDIEKHLLGK